MNIVKRKVVIRTLKVKGNRGEQQDKMRMIMKMVQVVTSHTKGTNITLMLRSGRRLSLCGDIAMLT